MNEKIKEFVSQGRIACACRAETNIGLVWFGPDGGAMYIGGYNARELTDDEKKNLKIIKYC